MGRAVTADQKQAMQRGRRDAAAVDAYLKALRIPKRRGRPISIDDLRARRARALADADTGEGIARLKSLQAAADLEARIEAASDRAEIDIDALAEGFVAVAARYSAQHGISYSTWREAGVPAAVLKQAGIRQTRRRNQTTS